MMIARCFVVATAGNLDLDLDPDPDHSMVAAAVLLDSDPSMAAAVAAVVYLDFDHSKIGCWTWVDLGLDFETAVWAYFHSVVPVE